MYLFEIQILQSTFLSLTLGNETILSPPSSINRFGGLRTLPLEVFASKDEFEMTESGCRLILTLLKAPSSHKLLISTWVRLFIKNK